MKQLLDCHGRVVTVGSTLCSRSGRHAVMRVGEWGAEVSPPVVDHALPDEGRSTLTRRQLADKRLGLWVAHNAPSKLLEPTTSGMLEYQLRVLKHIEIGHRAITTPYGSAKTWIAMTAAAMRSKSLHGAQTIELRTVYAESMLKCRPLALVICGKRNVITWQLEIQKRYPDAQVLVGLRGIDVLVEHRRAGLSVSNVVVLMPRNLLAGSLSMLLSAFASASPMAFVCDESTCLKNPNTQLSKAGLKLSSSMSHDCMRLVLTGRPMPEKAEEIWAQFEFCWPGKNPLGRTYYDFLRRWFVRGDRGYALALNTRDEFFRLVRQYIVELTADELSEWRSAMGITKSVPVIETYEETSEQRALIDHLLQHWEMPASLEASTDEELATSLDTQQVTAGLSEDGRLVFNNTMSVAAKYQQLTSGFYYDNQKMPVFLRRNPKLELLVDVVERLRDEKPGRQIVVWHHFKAERTTIQRMLRVIDVDAVIGPGEDALRAFVAGAPVIIMPASTSQGFNELVRADVNIFVSCPWSSELREQALARLERLGQQSSVVTHIDLCSDRMLDREIVAALQAKSLDPLRLSALVRRHSPRLTSLQENA